MCMMKKIIIALLCTAALWGGACAESPSYKLQDVTPDTFSSYWKLGEAYSAERNLENPVIMGVRWRRTLQNSLAVITPKMIVSYLAYSHQKRLIEMPSNFESLIEKNNDIVYLATYSHFQTSGNLFGNGQEFPSVPTQRLLIEKNGVWYHPVAMPAELETLMPHSHGLVYYGFPRSLILNYPYTIRYINGFGDPINEDIDESKIKELVEGEQAFYTEEGKQH